MNSHGHKCVVAHSNDNSKIKNKISFPCNSPVRTIKALTENGLGRGEMSGSLCSEPCVSDQIQDIQNTLQDCFARIKGAKVYYAHPFFVESIIWYHIQRILGDQIDQTPSSKVDRHSITNPNVSRNLQQHPRFTDP